VERDDPSTAELAPEAKHFEEVNRKAAVLCRQVTGKSQAIRAAFVLD
jgi:hypothetical protein